MVPALLATQLVFAAGLLALVAQAALSQGPAPWTAWLPGLLLLAASTAALARLVPAYDRVFYETNAFYSEVFRSAGGVRLAGREPVPYRSVYWVPRRFKPAVWASLRQLDRALPLGRFVACGHLLLWLLFYLDAPARGLAVYLVLFVTAKNGAAVLLAAPGAAPDPFQLVLHPPRAWAATRFFVSLRWTPPFLGSLGLVALLDPDLGLPGVLAWTAADVVAAFLTACLATYGTEVRYRKHYA
jgi:hypothetical protein